MTELESFHRTVHADIALGGVSPWSCSAWPCRAVCEEVRANDCECECNCGCECRPCSERSQ